MKKILYVSLIDWFWIKQRPQQISELLSENCKVDFFCISGWSGDKPDAELLKSYKLTSDGALFINENLSVYRSHVLPKRDSPLFRSINYKIIERNRIKRLLSKNHYDAIVLTFPAQALFFSLKQLTENIIIYDCMDDYVNFFGAKKDKLLEEESTLISSASIVIASSRNLADKLEKRNKGLKVEVINNGVSLDNFSNFKSNIREKTVVGYIGAVDSWFDFASLKTAALNMPNVLFDIYGPIKVDIQKYDLPNNVHFKGRIEYTDIPKIASVFSVAIMPFVVTDLIKSVNPVKVYEYLAMGLKTVASRYQETERFKDLIWLYDDNEGLSNRIKQAIEYQDSATDIELRKSFAGSNSWESRANRFWELIEQS